MAIRYFIKGKTHKNWTKLSLSTHQPITNEIAADYVKQYAADRLNVPENFEIRGLSDDGTEYIYPLAGFTDPIGANGVNYPWAV